MGRAPPSQLVLLERFDGDLWEWTVDAGGGTVAISEDTGDRKLVLTARTGPVEARRPVAMPTVPYLVEADLNARSGVTGRLEVTDGRRALAWVQVEANTHTGTFGTDVADGRPFAWDPEWDAVVLKVDPAAANVTCWRMTYYATPGSSGTAWTPVATMRFSAGTGAALRLRTVAGTGVFVADEIRVFVPDLFAIGDSVTAGTSPEPYPYWNPHPARRGNARQAADWPYPDRVGTRFVPRRWVANRGVAGELTSATARRLRASVIDQGAKRVFVLAGINDVAAGRSAPEIEANLRRIIDTVTAAGLPLYLGTITPRDANTPEQDAVEDRVNDWVRAWDGPLVRVVEIHDRVTDPDRPGTWNPAYTTDRIHPNAAGLALIADAVVAALEDQAAAPAPPGDPPPGTAGSASSATSARNTRNATPGH